MRKLFLILLASTSLIFAENLPVQSFALGFWPEYDHPGVLVTFSMVADADELPLDFEIVLPEGAKMALQTEMTENGEQNLIPQEIIEQDGKLVMPVHIEHPQHYIQFYYNPFGLEAERILDYDFILNTDLAEITVIVQENLAAENFTTSLDEPEIVRDDFGFSYQRQYYQNLKAGEPLNVKVEYSNPNARFSVDVLKEIMDQHSEFGMTGENQEEAPGVKPAAGLNIWQRILVPVSVVIFVIILMLMLRQKKTLTAGNGKNKFCTSCGNKLLNDQQFCTSCGAENK